MMQLLRAVALYMLAVARIPASSDQSATLSSLPASWPEPLPC
jgi:hypothetical protein